MVAGIVPALTMTPHAGLHAPGKTAGWPQPRQGDPLELYTTFLRKKPSKR
jgi:hypothetical protein